MRSTYIFTVFFKRILSLCIEQHREEKFRENNREKSLYLRKNGFWISTKNSRYDDDDHVHRETNT